MGTRSTPIRTSFGYLLSLSLFHPYSSSPSGSVCFSGSLDNSTPPGSLDKFWPITASGFYVTENAFPIQSFEWTHTKSDKSIYQWPVQGWTLSPRSFALLLACTSGMPRPNEENRDQTIRTPVRLHPSSLEFHWRLRTLAAKALPHSVLARFEGGAHGGKIRKSKRCKWFQNKWHQQLRRRKSQSTQREIAWQPSSTWEWCLPNCLPISGK